MVSYVCLKEATSGCGDSHRFCNFDRSVDFLSRLCVIVLR